MRDQPSLAHDPCIGRVDGGELLIGKPHELFRHAARNQAVGMVLPHEQTIGALDLFLACAVIDAQDDIGVGPIRLDVRGADAAEFVG